MAAEGFVLGARWQEVRIRGRRISVEDIAIRHERLGKSAEEIASEYDLTLGDVRYLTDEHVPSAAARGLRARGVDVITAAQAGTLQKPDLWCSRMLANRAGF